MTASASALKKAAGPEMEYSAFSRSDLLSLSRRMEDLPREQLNILLAAVWSANLMQMRGAARLISIAVTIRRWITGNSRYACWLLFWQQATNDLVDQALQGLTQHLLFGQEAEAQGAGGFNQDEINAIAAILDRVEAHRQPL